MKIVLNLLINIYFSEKDDKEKKLDSSKFTAMGYFANLAHYMKLYEILRMAYSNYKVSDITKLIKLNN